MKKNILLTAVAALSLASCSALKDGEYNLSLVTTGDGHGNWFSKPLVDGGKARGSLMSQSKFVNDIRADKGRDNVILIDAGDNFLGSTASFYYDYADTLTPYLYPRLAEYMRYDAVVAGHSDFEAGHGVFDRASEGFRKAGIPFLAGNAINKHTGKSYLPSTAIVKKNGVKVAILGYTNADNDRLMDKNAYSGIEFESLIPLVQQTVDDVRKKEKPQVVIVVAHTSVGKGEGNNIEKQGLDLYQSLRGVDFVVAAHDHGSKVMSADSIILMQSGRGGQSVGVGDIKLVVKGGKVISREITAKTVNLNVTDVDKSMEEAFTPEFNTVKAFASSKVGVITEPMISREFYWGQCDYMNFLHTLSLTWTYPVDISLGATLLIDGRLEAGDVTFNDIRKVYPYENKLVVLQMTGEEVRKYLEASYELWINTIANPETEHVLNIKESKDWGTGKMVWKLAKSPANFDSAAGICYTVDVTKPYGSRVNITSMADGSKFSLEKTYSVGITTYRAVGSGGMLKAAGLDSTEAVEARTIYRGPEFRTILYEYLKRNGSINPAVIGNPKVVGSWKFVPESAVDGIQRDVELLYGNRKDG